MKSFHLYFIILFFFTAGTFFLIIGMAVEQEEQQQLSMLLDNYQSYGFFRNMFFKDNIGLKILNYFKKDKQIETEKYDVYDKKVLKNYESTIDQLKTNIETHKEKNEELNSTITTQQNRISELTEQLQTNITLYNWLKEQGLSLKTEEDEIIIPKHITQIDTQIDIISQEQIKIPAGYFIMGPPENPKTIYLDEYYIDKYEVTNYMYSQFDNDHNYNPVHANLPVTNITFYQAQQYAESLNMRLPTEKEWEKAARGTNGYIFPWGNDWDTNLANTIENKEIILKPVDSFPEGISPFGVYNMSGNVFEWTSTTNENDYAVTKGGSFLNPKDFAKTYYRTYENKNSIFSAVGFRCVKD